MPVWYDIEENSVFATGKANVSKIAEVFCEALKAAGYKVGIYSSYYTFKTYFTEEVKNKYDIWLAHVGNGGYPLSQTGYDGHKEMWQYSWKGVIKGIKGDVDEDWCYKDYTSAATSDPVTPPSPVTPDKPTDGGG
jgi:GH25 family lysozyme M1 (1,4-beta-N-acetylmuramidase)